MGRALKAGLYPDAPGSHQVFRNKRRDPDNPAAMAKPAAALVAGLGEEGKLREVDLVYTVRQAVLAYAQRLSESKTGAHSQFDLAATLIGSGGTGITPGAAARAIAQGVLEANGKLQDNGWPRVGQLLLIEQYLDRAGEAWHALQLQEQSAPSRLKLVGKIGFGPGALRRPLDSGYRGARHDFISALKVPGRDPAHPCITYTLDTRRARTEVRAQHAQGSLLRQLVTTASNDANNDPLIGRTLFNLLVPIEIEPFLAGTGELVLEVDPDTASIPWEILDTNPDDQSADNRPWAIRSKLVRKLRIDTFRDKPRDATVDDSVLVIGEPLADRARYPRLEGARREAIAVAAELSAPGRGIPAERVHALVDQADAQTIINALFARPYRIVHVAGHGEPGANGGVVLSGDGIYLGSAEVEAMRVVPELVFLNCCHLAAREATIALPSYDRAQFAANIAESLIRVGVRCVVAAGWAVEDNPAAEFASHFYETLLIGGRFIDAVGAARAAALRANPSGNTWAAYQCYGDPEWTWRREGVDAQRPTQPLSDELAGVASPVSLTLALETLAIQGELGGRGPAYLLDRLRFLEAEFAPLWGAMGAVAEAFGVAYAAAQDAGKAIAWFQAALDAHDRSASLRTADRLADMLSRRSGKRPR
jgi:CHAT domain-containing protein